MSDARRNRLTLLAAGLLIAAFLAQGWAFIVANSQTFDEGVHLTAGYSYLTTGDFRLNGEHPPLIKLLCALAVFLRFRIPFDPDPRDWDLAASGRDDMQWRISDAFLNQGPIPAHDLIVMGRLPNLLLGACLLALLGWWAHRLWGRGAALLAMGVAAFEPTLIAHACVITTDMPVTLFTFLTLFLLWQFSAEPSGRLLVCIGLSFGLVVVSKFSALLIAMILVGCIGTHLLCGGRFALAADSQTPPLRARIVEAIAPTMRIFAIAIVVILPFYFFQGFALWSTGLRTQMNQQSTGVAAFFLGERSLGGWWYYFPTAFAIKTPVGTLVLLAAALATIRLGQPFSRREFAFVLMPVILYVLALTQLRLNIGLRYALPVYPLLFLTIGHLATVCRRTWHAALVLSAVVATAASSLANSPYQLTYFNELVGGPSQGRRYLTDSNIDWGQGLIGLKEYLDRENITHVYLSYYGTARPAAYGIPAQPLPGFGQLKSPEASLATGGNVLAISVTALQALEESDFAWLADRKPAAEIGHCILIFDLTGDRDAHDHLAALYERHGAPRLAAIERAKGPGANVRR